MSKIVLPIEVDIGGVIFEKGSSFKLFIDKMNLYRQVAFQKQELTDLQKKKIHNLEILISRLSGKKFWQSNKGIIKKFNQEFGY